MSLAQALCARVDTVSTECLQSFDLGLDVLDDDIEMHAVLSGFGLGHALEDEWRCDPLSGYEDGDRAVVVVLPIVEHLTPEVGELLWICAVEHEIHPRLVSHLPPPAHRVSQPSLTPPAQQMKSNPRLDVRFARARPRGVINRLRSGRGVSMPPLSVRAAPRALRPDCVPCRGRRVPAARRAPRPAPPPG